MITVNFEALNEVSYEVERYNKSIGRKEDLEYKVPVSAFLEGLLYNQQKFKMSGEYDEYGEPLGDYEFITLLTNPRLSKKAMSVYFAVKDRIDYSDFISNVYTKIYDTIMADGIDYVNINYDNYSTERDYISKLVFLIDKEVRREALEESGLKYNRGWEEDNLPMYENKFGIEVRLDGYNAEQETHNENFISTEEVIGCKYKTAEEVEEDDFKLKKLIDSVNLTDRQKEYLDVLISNDYNQTHAAKEMEISDRASRAILSRIRDNFKLSIESKSSITVFEKLEDLLDTDRLDEIMIADFIKDNIDKDMNFQDFFYSVSTDKKRGDMVLYLQGLSIHSKELKPYIIDFLKEYYLRIPNTTPV